MLADEEEGERPPHRRLLDDFPRVEYRRCTNDYGLVHWGQLKLLLSEMEFLLRFRDGGTSNHVVYAGAAPGNHIYVLLDLFPDISFTLVDPNPIVVPGSSRVTVRQEVMTESIAAEYSGMNNVLFISDIRTGPSAKLEPLDVHQERIHRDMLDQMSWYCAMRPASALLKFRLPWSTHESVEYLGGEIMLPVFGKFLTHEARLCVQGPEAMLVTYRCREYEGRMAYFNQFVRACRDESGAGYDERRFRDIVARYLRLGVHDLRVWLWCNKVVRSLGLACSRRGAGTGFARF